MDSSRINASQREPLPQPADSASPVDDQPRVDEDAQAPVQSATPIVLRFRLMRDVRKRLDLYITDRVPYLSRAKAQRLIENEGVRVNGKQTKSSTILRQGDLVELSPPAPPATGVTPEFLDLAILLEDDDIIAINKTPGVLVHPARGNLHGTLVAGLLWRFQQQAGENRGLSTIGQAFARPGVIHRLDRDTSGVILFAKRDEIHWRIARQFEERTVEKRYIALVEGEVEPSADVIEASIGPHPNRAKGYRERMVVRQDSFGKNALTIYRTLERFDGYSLVELEIKTGRTHQIRVHMSHLGYPLVGDDMYGGAPALRLSDLAVDAAQQVDTGGQVPIIERQALHAAMLRFTHPGSGARVTLTAPLPDDIRCAIELLRKHKPGRGKTGLTGAALDLDALLVRPGSNGSSSGIVKESI